MRRANLAVIVRLKLLLVPREAKITHFYCPIVVNQHILALHIAMEQLALVQVEQCHSHLLRNLNDARIVQDKLLMMQKVKETAHADKFGDHVEVGVYLLVKAHAHVQDDVGVAQLVEHLDLLDEVLERLPRHISLAELLYCDLGSHPTRLKHVTVATSSDKICLCVDLQLSEVDVEVESVFAQSPDQAGLLTESYRRLRVYQAVVRVTRVESLHLLSTH